MNLKLIGAALINFDNVLHVTFEATSGGKALKATLRFVDGSERIIDHAPAVALLSWINFADKSEIDVIASLDQLEGLKKAFVQPKTAAPLDAPQTEGGADAPAKK